MQNLPADKTFTSLSQVADYYQRQGYNHTFTLEDKHENPEEWCIAGLYRFEGASNPSDNSIVYLLHKKDGSSKGLLVNAYGIYSTSKINRFIEKVVKCSAG